MHYKAKNGTKEFSFMFNPPCMNGGSKWRFPLMAARCGKSKPKPGTPFSLSIFSEFMKIRWLEGGCPLVATWTTVTGLLIGVLNAVWTFQLPGDLIIGLASRGCAGWTLLEFAKAAPTRLWALIGKQKKRPMNAGIAKCNILFITLAWLTQILCRMLTFLS